MKIYLDAFLAKNLGDDLFLDILLNRYKNHKFYAIARGEKYNDYPNLQVYGNSFAFRGIKKLRWEKYIANMCELVVTIGGSMYMEFEGINQDFYLGKNKRYIMGVNFGPYNNESFLNNVRNVFKNAEDICFRDKYSYDLFKDLSNVRYAPDIVFGINTNEINITNRKRAIISVVSCDFKVGKSFTRQYEEKMIELIKFLMNKGYEICLMSFCKKQDDEKAIESILNKYDEYTRKKIATYYYNGNAKEALNVIGDSSLVIGSRFHANVIGMALGKAVIPVYYSDKTKNVIEDMEVEMKTVDIRNIQDFDINSLTDEDLTKVVDVSKYRIEAQKHFKELDKILLNGEE